MTPASVISAIRSLPSGVRSPTPANTDTPPWFLATRAIISWISTVLPTPAPPNRPIFPPVTYGVSRSMTLMPVSNIVVFGSSWSKAGALRWMPHRSSTSNFSPSSRLRTSPVALKTLPSVASPTGTEIGPPVSVTGEPRTTPSVADVLGDLERQDGGLTRQGDLDLELVVDLGHRVGRELDVDDRADDPR